MAGYVAQNWNTILPSLTGVYTKLCELEGQYGGLSND